jgi:hypothetical protein
LCFVCWSFVLHLLLALPLLLLVPCFVSFFILHCCCLRWCVVHRLVLFMLVWSVALCYSCSLWYVTLHYSCSMWSIKLCCFCWLWSIILCCSCLLWSITLRYSYLLWFVALRYRSFLWFVILRYCFLLWYVTLCCCYSLCVLPSPCIIIVRYGSSLLTMHCYHSTPFPSAQLTFPCVVTTCCGLLFFILHCYCLLVEVMYSPPFLHIAFNK